MERQAVSSSNIASVGYDPNSETLEVEFLKSGKVYDSGKGSGLLFQDYGKGSPQFGSVVTTPTHNENIPNVETQTIDISATSLLGGYDAEIAGPNPWTPGRLASAAPGYLKGQGASLSEKAQIQVLGRVVHAYTDSSTSAGEFATGRKAYNNGVNVTDDGAFIPTLFQQLQDKGWKVGTVTSVPFPHASPAAMYAHNVHRDDYQDLGRDMLGLSSVAQELNKEPSHPGLDVVIGTGFGKTFTAEALTKAKFKDVAGANAVDGNVFITAADLAAIDLRHGGKYVVVHTEAGVEGASALNSAAAIAAKGEHRLFGFFGGAGFDHLPYQTANGDFKPTPSLKGTFETYSKADLRQNPKLADMTDAALTVLAASGKPFALFVEAGDVDWGLHDNNLDTAVGAVFSGEDAVARIIKWVERTATGTTPP